jgi:hypothetical protein
MIRPLHLAALAPAVVLVSLAACKSRSEPTHEHVHELNLPPVTASLSVTVDGKPATLDLAALARDAGTTSLPLTQVWRAAWPSQDPAHLRFDLVGSDGFRPMSRPKCTHLLTGDELSHLRLEVTTHNVSTDDGMDLPGCYRVKALVTIEGTAAR